jgi:excisionase family DNA binding protein
LRTVTRSKLQFGGAAMSSKRQKTVEELLQSEWLSTSSAAAIAGVSPSTIVKWCNDGLLASMATVGQHRRISTHELRSFLRNRNFTLSDKVRPTRILIVDDYPQLLRALSREARSSNYSEKISVSVVNNGVDALAMLATDKYDVVVLDVKMKGMDGFEVCRHIRASSYLGQVKVLLMTGSGDPSMDQTAKEVGAIDLVRKPLGLAMIVSKLAEHGLICD